MGLLLVPDAVLLVGVAETSDILLGSGLQAGVLAVEEKRALLEGAALGLNGIQPHEDELKDVPDNVCNNIDQ